MLAQAIAHNINGSSQILCVLQSLCSVCSVCNFALLQETQLDCLPTWSTSTSGAQIGNSSHPPSPSSITKQRQADFRLALIQAYQPATATALPASRQPLQCMITGLMLPPQIVMAAHLLSRTEALVRLSKATFCFAVSWPYSYLASH
jgi:hypothetical protein